MTAAKQASWLEVARRRDVVLRALRVAAVVGTLLCAINHGDRLLAGTLGFRDGLKIALTYLVPYAVSTYAAVGALRAEAQRGASSSVGR
ncbi:MAG: nitrate/nitrite transporter NrtS [Planctomycetes bacterium]|nr:nitrate/nitrite transporter NrtS [Planctomycetota bacterium]